MPADRKTVNAIRRIDGSAPVREPGIPRITKNLNLPAPLWARLAEIAAEDHRPVNNLIEHLLTTITKEQTK